MLVLAQFQKPHFIQARCPTCWQSRASKNLKIKTNTQCVSNKTSWTFSIVTWRII